MEKIRYYNDLNINEKINIKSRHLKSISRLSFISRCKAYGSTALPRHEQPFANSIEFMKNVSGNSIFLRKF